MNQNSSALRLLVGGDQESFDIVLADQTRLRGVLDVIFAFVGLFSVDGMVVDVNRLPLQVSKLRRVDFVGRRFVDVPWFAHSAVERDRIAGALERAAGGEKVRLEITIVGADAEIRHVDAAFAPLHDSGGSITHVVGTGIDDTVRKRALDALSASEARLAEAQRVAHVGSWEWTVGTNTVVWSDELHRIYGVSKAHWNGSYEAFLARVHPDDLDHTRAVVSHALLNVTPFVYDHRIVRADGRVRMLHTRGEVLPDAQGRPERLVGSCWDVTDRWVATRQLEDSVSLLRSTLEATADGILLVDLSGEVRALNQRLRALWRLPDEVAEGTTVDELLALVSDQLEDPGQFRRQTSQLYREPKLERLDVLRFKDGRVFERYSRPQREGAAISGRVCSFRDITQRERLLRDAEAARVASERAREEMDHVLERVSDGFVALDRQWRYTYVNTCGGRLLNREAPSLLGKHIWTEFPEGVGQTFHLAYERAVAEQKPQWIREHFPPWNRWFENRIYPSADGISVFFTDVTQQQETEERLRSSADQLRALAARLDAIREEERRTMARENPRSDRAGAHGPQAGSGLPAGPPAAGDGPGRGSSAGGRHGSPARADPGDDPAAVCRSAAGHARGARPGRRHRLAGPRAGGPHRDPCPRGSGAGRPGFAGEQAHRSGGRARAVPDPPGGAHQRRPARRCPPGPGPAGGRARGVRVDGARRRPGHHPGGEDPCLVPGPRRHARAGLRAGGGGDHPGRPGERHHGDRPATTRGRPRCAC